MSNTFQSTWDPQRIKHKPRYGTGYGQQYSNEDTDGAGYGGLDRGSKSLFATHSMQQTRVPHEAPNYPELPNLKVPQIALGKVNLVAPSGSLSSPRNGYGPPRDVLSIGRKHRTSSRQSGQSHRSRRNKFIEQYSTGAEQPPQQQQQQQQPIPTSTKQFQTFNPDTLPHIQQAGSALNQQVAALKKPPLIAPSLSLGKESSNGASSFEEHHFAAVSSLRGLKPGNPNWINQDNYFILETFDNKDTRIYCVLDGHGENGHLVSKRCRETFPQIIKACGLDMDRSFNTMQNDLNASEIDVRCSGATCVMATVIAGKVSVYNCGDSRAVLGRRNGNGSVTAHPLSSDHKPDKPEERRRIIGCGGHLGCRQVLVNQGGRGPVSMPVGPCRVWYQHRGETLGLAMSRSLGDAIVHKVGVSAEPEVMDHVIDDSDEFLILATDGVWDVVDNNHAVQMVHSFAVRSVNWSPLEASNCICKFARSRWEKLSPMIDDITCVVIKLQR